MTDQEALKSDVSTHFEFGENWADFATRISAEHIAEAERGVTRLLPPEEVDGRSVLDIGSGSGLHALAFLRMGARHVTAIDFDPNSVATTTATLETHAPAAAHETLAANILDPATLPARQYDIVYSWGVLHHTGAMWEAVENAFEFVKPGGRFVIALYVETPFCGLWRTEKRLYTAAPAWLRAPVTWVYAAICWLRILASGRNPQKVIAAYNRYRGMSWYHDRIDWLGGYPYESASAEAVSAFMKARGAQLERSFDTAPRLAPLGTGCGEYVFRKAPESP